jgi:thioredoxin reductase (NADPH)
MKTLVISHGMATNEDVIKEKASKYSFGIVDDKIIGLSGFEEIKLNGILNEYSCKSLILAMDAPEKELDFDGIHSFRGNGISYCAACDGFFYTDKKIAVLGYNDFMAHESAEIKELSDDVTILTNGKPLEISEDSRRIIQGIRVDDGKIKGFYGVDYLLGVVFESGRKEEFDGVFIAYGDATALEISLKTGLLTEDDRIVTDENQCTNLPNIFAAGGCTGGTGMNTDVLSAGTKAAKSAINYLKSLV